MELTDNEYSSIFDLELNKYIREHPNKKIFAIICKKAEMALETSSNFISIKEKDGIHYLWRSLIEVIIEDDYFDCKNNEFYFVTEDEYRKENYNGKS